MRGFRFFALAVVVGTLGVRTAAAQGGPPAGGGAFRLAPLLMQSDAFEDGGVVPAQYSFRGGNTQPGFTFSNAPPQTVSYAIILHDIDVALRGTVDDVTHWVVWNIPAGAGGIPEGALPDGAVQGKNMANQNSYFGPGAPAGPRYHHYVFELFALSASLDLPDTAGRAELVAAMNGKIVGKAAYVGRFKGSE